MSEWRQYRLFYLHHGEKIGTEPERREMSVHNDIQF